MTTARYNPLTYSDNLKKAGMDEKVANVIAQQQEEMVSIDNENLATKQDLRMFHLKMIIQIGGMMVVQSGLTIAILEFLKHV